MALHLHLADDVNCGPEGAVHLRREAQSFRTFKGISGTLQESTALPLC